MAEAATTEGSLESHALDRHTPRFLRYGQGLEPISKVTELEKIRHSIPFVARAKRCVNEKEGKLYFLRPPEENEGFWSARRGKEAAGLVHISTIPTYHRIRGDGAFFPTHEEYQRQIPPELVTQVAAIEFRWHHRSDLQIVDDMYQIETKLYGHESSVKVS